MLVVVKWLIHINQVSNNPLFCLLVRNIALNQLTSNSDSSTLVRYVLANLNYRPNLTG